MPYLDKPAINVLQGCKYDEIQRLVFAMILKVADLKIHPLGGE